MKPETSLAQALPEFGHSAIVGPSEAGRLAVTGKDALDLLHRLSTNELKETKVGSLVGTVLTTEKGRIVDYVKLLRLRNRLLLLTSPRKAGEVKGRIEKFCIMEDVQTQDLTSSTVMYSLVGGEVDSAIRLAFDTSLERNSGAESKILDFPCMVVHDFDFGVDSAHLIADATRAEQIRDHLKTWFRVADSTDYEAYRILLGIPETGCELTESYNPYEAGLGHAVSLTKGCYIGQEVLARLDTYGKANRRGLVRLRFNGSADKQGGGSALFKGSREVGRWTSISRRPVQGAFVGLGIVALDLVKQGDLLRLSSGGARVEAEVTEIPMGSTHPE